MNKVLKVLVVLPAILFLVMGVRWLVAPAGVAPQFGLSLAEGVGLSSQVGDMSGYFLTASACMLIALISGRRTWYYPPIMMLLITATGRTLAWLVHGAAFATQSIFVEVVVAAILIVASRRLPDQD